MLRLPKIINKTLSLRLSLMVVSAMALLLMASMIVMLYYSRKAVKEEALQKASQALEATVQNIDNILLSVEQTAGNFYFSLQPYIHQPDMMHTYALELVESNPYVVGCAIAMKPGYYKDGELFMAYYHHSTTSANSPIVQSETFVNRPYTEQLWYTRPMDTYKPGWMNPLGNNQQLGEVTETQNTSDYAPIITFSLPLSGDDGKPAGVLGVDVSLDLLSSIILSVKPSPNSYCTLLDSIGSYIVHPDGDKLIRQTVFTISGHYADPSVKEAAEAMISGQTGYKPFRKDNTDYYVFYKPFSRSAIPGRSMERLGWSAGIIYPEDDIFGDYNNLSYYVLAIAVIGMLLLFLLCRVIIHRQLKPLLMLTASAQRIAKGKYFEPIPDSHQQDEIGRLQDNFQKMQQSLASYIGELEQLTTTLKEHGEDLRTAYNEAQKADRMKTSFLHNMTNQMVGPANSIDRDVDTLCNCPDAANRSQLADNIQSNGKTITDLLKNLINISDEERIRKEGDDEK
jgi:HAMP domain-containing protein